MKTNLANILIFLCLLISGCCGKGGCKKNPVYIPKLFYLDVASVVIIDDTATTNQRTSNQFVPSSLVPDLQKWANEHFVAHGKTGRALVRIIDGRVTTMEVGEKSEDREMEANVIMSVEFIDTDPTLRGKILIRATISKNFSTLGWSQGRQQHIRAFLIERVFESIEQQFYKQFLQQKLVKV